MERWPEPVERVATALREAAVDARVEELAAGTPTADAAARALGCRLSVIVKSLVLVCDGRIVLALVPGDRRADTGLVAGAVRARRARIASADEVQKATGFEPGGVAPFPVPAGARVLVDRPLLEHELVWAGAGSPRHMVALAPPDLLRLTGAEPAELSS
jgi:prolyl-tRNA editing enzyme YbaK/EbsC (Cys-tRNA(Pro) deacylase)